jgi:peptide deformylase
MVETMYEAPGVGLAAPQVGVQKRLFVYDLHDGLGARTMINPVISDSRGEWEFEEGCLSVPGLYFTIVRPKEIHLTGYDLDGNEISIEADEYEARVFQHEVDHLDGTLLLERLTDDDRKAAMKALRNRDLS